MKSQFFVCALLAALLPGTVIAQTAPDKTMQLLQMIADQQAGGGSAEITVGALPDDVPKVPLPKAEIVGSIRAQPTGTIGTLVTSTYNLYYLASDAQIKSYSDALVAAGWKRQSVFGQGGFEPNDSNGLTIYCSQQFHRSP